jgi:hypothetical protein
MPPTLEALTADRAIACLRRAIEELAAGRPRDALTMVANAQDSASVLRGMIEAQISNDELKTFHNAPQALGAS